MGEGVVLHKEETCFFKKQKNKKKQNKKSWTDNLYHSNSRCMKSLSGSPTQFYLLRAPDTVFFAPGCIVSLPNSDNYFHMKTRISEGQFFEHTSKYIYFPRGKYIYISLRNHLSAWTMNGEDNKLLPQMPQLHLAWPRRYLNLTVLPIWLLVSLKILKSTQLKRWTESQCVGREAGLS